MLLGRAAEQSVIEGLLAGARAGRGGVLVVHGEPGIGKTALLDYAAAAVRAGPPGAASAASPPGGPAPPGVAGARVIRGTGVESEAELPFAGLHALLGPVLNGHRSLPGPQRDALAAAFGLRYMGSRDRLLVGLAVLSLLAELAEDGPLVCLVDDAHRLDRDSAEALVFAARRLGSGRIVIIFAARDHDTPFPAAGLPELHVSPLDAAAAAELLSRHGHGLPAEARRRILGAARGNPLGLVELCAAYADSPHAARSPGGTALPLTDRLQRAFEGQVRRLPADTQTLLLAAASEESDDLGVVLDAAGALDVAATAMGPAEQAGLVDLADGTVSFRHPLVRVAVRQAATLSRRLAVHRALAGALRGPVDAGRRAWHLAAAATGPDDGVAAELERTAGEGGARGGYPAAAAAYERAADLTTDPAAQAGRLALAAEARAETGDFDHARGLATRGRAADPIVQARLAAVRARADAAQGQLAAAHRLLVDGAATITGLDPVRSARMLMHAMHVAWLAGEQALVAGTADRLTAAGGCAAELAPLVQLMLCLADQARGWPGGQPRLAELVARARRLRKDDPCDLAMIAMAAMVTGRNSDARELLMALAADARAHGKIGWLPALQACLAQALLFDGRHQGARASAGEGVRIARDTGQRLWAGELNAIMAYLAAVGGRRERCHQLVDAAQAEPTGAAGSASRPWVPWALGLLDLGHGRLDTALAQLETIAHGPARYHATALRSIPDLVEAAVRLGQPERAAAPLARFSDWAQRACAPDTDALAERCHALLAADDDTERHYLAALKLHGESFERARTQLLYGAWLRRARRKADARMQLRAAVDCLDRAGAAPWAEQARAELSATGITTPRAKRAGLPRLTPQERQIAQLAARGLSNRDIAARLFLSQRTVGYHLYKAYPKLGITSRSQLELDALAP